MSRPDRWSMVQIDAKACKLNISGFFLCPKKRKKAQFAHWFVVQSGVHGKPFNIGHHFVLLCADLQPFALCHLVPFCDV